jgi:POT family proton-dependent oligopeptide transporter
MANDKYLTSPPKITGWPPGVPYIIGNEAAERFSYYGMNSVLTIFMTKYLLDKMGHLSVMPAAAAEAWYHTFVSVLYFLPLLGAILADAFFGKFKVVLWLSIVYCLGHATLALMGSSVAHTIEPRYLLAIGLVAVPWARAASNRVFRPMLAISSAKRTSIFCRSFSTGSTFPSTRAQPFQP